MQTKPKLKDFLEVAFDENENIFTCTAAVEKGPPVHNRTSRSRGQAETLEGLNTAGGVFIGINPCDDTGALEKLNVTSIRNIVFECDTMPVKEQVALVKKLKVPYSAAVFSGGKSVHFWICLDTPIDQFTFVCYTKRLQQYLKDNGYPADESICKENQLMRFPTAIRGEKEQKLYQVKGRISESDFCCNFINEVCPAYSPPKYEHQSSGTIKKSNFIRTEVEAEIHCNDKWPLEAGMKQGNLISWAKFLVGNTNLSSDQMVALIASNDRGNNCNIREYERAVGRATSMLEK